MATSTVKRWVLVSGTIALLVGCSDADRQARDVRERAGEQADATRKQGDRQAEALREQADQQANNLERQAEGLEKQASMTKRETEKKADTIEERTAKNADVIENQAEKRADTIEASDSWKTDAKMSRNDIRQAQLQLKSRGFLKGEADGFMGQQTRTAIRDFQRAESLPETGMLTRETRDRLSQAAGEMNH